MRTWCNPPSGMGRPELLLVAKAGYEPTAPAPAHARLPPACVRACMHAAIEHSCDLVTGLAHA